MRLGDTLQFASGSLRGSPTRTLLMMLAMSIGVAAVVVLTALGEGARRYVVNQFASLGTNLVIVLPGRTETAGIGPGMLLGQIPREITLDDATAILDSPAVKRIAPLTVGSASLSRGALNREVVVLGSTADFLEVRHMSMGLGRFLPAGDIRVEIASPGGGSGLGVSEGWRGEVLVGVELAADGRLARVHPHDPSWQAWPALEHAVMKDIVPDFPLINKSFNLSYSGVDL